MEIDAEHPPQPALNGNPTASTQTEPVSDVGNGASAEKGTEVASVSKYETDGRNVQQWKSRYPESARSEIRLEAFVVAAILLSSLLMIFLIWSGFLADGINCKLCRRPAFSRYGYFFLGGVLGGTLFGIKFLYHVVAKGYWNQDRRLWRLLSPLLAGSLAFIVGALTDAGFLGLTISANKSSAFLSLGFITGYFGDKALAKMTEMADVIFGTRDSTKQSNPSTKANEQ